MSFRVIERTFAHTAQRGSFLAALFFLADRADDSGVSWYGVRKIAETINLGQRQTRDILSTLRERGEIWYTPRFFSDGSQTSNGYLVCCGASLDVIGAALYHPELQLTDEGIEAALSEIAAARGERLTDDGPWTADDDLVLTDNADQAPVDNAEVAPSDLSCVERTQDDVAEPANGPEYDCSRAAPDARPPPNGTPAGIDADALWDQVLCDMQQTMPREVFKAHLLGTSAEWLGDVPSSTMAPSNGDVVIQSKGEPPLLQIRASPASVPWLVHRYQERAELFVADHAGQPVAIAFVGRDGGI